MRRAGAKHGWVLGHWRTYAPTGMTSSPSGAAPSCWASSDTLLYSHSGRASFRLFGHDGQAAQLPGSFPQLIACAANAGVHPVAQHRRALCLTPTSAHAPNRRQPNLLDHNAGHGEGSFIRLDGQGLRGAALRHACTCQELDGQIEAALTYLNTAMVWRRLLSLTHRTDDNQAPRATWSLGPRKTCPWPARDGALPAVDGERRRPVVAASWRERT